MLVIKQKRIYRSDLRNNPHILYLFGDNLDRTGYGGQAAEMRDEPNAFGIATKNGPGGNKSDYFYDLATEKINPIVGHIIDHEFNVLKLRLFKKTFFSVKPEFKAVVIPEDGLGTGLAMLPEYAPKTLEYIEKKLKEIETW